MFDLDYLKCEFSEKDYNYFIRDINEKFPKYKKALLDYYENNNEKFPFNDYPFINDILLVIFLNEYEYNKELVLKVLDNMFLSIDNAMHKVLVLNFLCGFGVINKEEFDKRNPYKMIMHK